MKITYKQFQDSLHALKQQLHFETLKTPPSVAVVLGSGLGAFAESLQEKRIVPFDKVPHLPVSTVAGHAGRFVFGLTESGVPVLAQQGRIHYYEGHDLSEVTLPIRLLHALGVQNLILTTSTGSINPAYNPGEFMVFVDHINFPQLSPLSGLAKEFGERFVDVSVAYDGNWRQSLCQAVSSRPDIVLHQGVFAYVVGPNYETPAEIRMLRTLGADVVSMSTVPEVLVARQCGLKILALANITNYGAGLKQQVLDHAHVAKAANASAEKMVWILNAAVKMI